MHGVPPPKAWNFNSYVWSPGMTGHKFRISFNGHGLSPQVTGYKCRILPNSYGWSPGATGLKFRISFNSMCILVWLTPKI